MATLNVSTIKTSLGWTYPDDVDIVESTNSGSITYSTSLPNGTGSAQADKIYFVRGTLAASGSTTINLTSGLTDPYGAAVVFARIKVLNLKNTRDVAVTGSILQVGGAAANAFVNWVANTTDIVNVRANGTLFLTAPDATGYAVGTGVNLLMTNASGSTSASFDLVLIGASA